MKAAAIAGLGIAIGLAYAWSPLLVVTGIGFALLLRSAMKTPDAEERRWLVMLLAVGIATRVVAVGALFLSTDHQAVPFGWIFGDEEYFIRRSIWLRNVALGIPISVADMKYAFDEAIQTTFVWILAGIELVFGPAPYGLHLVSALAYVWGSTALYRLVRPSFGAPAALAGLGVLLFLPSLFAWSISVLKEPAFFALLVAAVTLTAAVGRHPRLAARAAAVAGVAVVAIVAGGMREGGLVIVAAGATGGIALAIVATRRRLALALVAVALVALPPLALSGAVRDRATAAVARAATRHWDHVHAPGHSYMLFAPEFYREPPVPGDLSPADAARLVAGGLLAYAVVPTPWQMQSRAELAYLPEQLAWYALVLLAPIGLVAAFRRDPFLASVLAANLAVAVALVAWTSGNIGTLVRHRALALPYLVWFSGLGLAVVLAWASRPRETTAPLVRQEAEA